MTRHFTERAGHHRKLLLLGAGTALVTTAVALVLVAAPRISAQSSQTAEATAPAFEVASIKLNHSNENMIMVRFSPGRFSANGVTIKELIKNAYHVKDDQLSGLPSWVSSDRYDIEAKMTDATAEMMQKLPQDQSVEQHRLLIQSLLTDRSKLKVGHETKELPLYALVVAKNGPKLLESTAPPPPPGGNLPPTPGGPMRPGMMRMGRGELTASAVPLARLADVLSGEPDIGGRVIVDETGLKGKYDINLHWTPESPSPMAAGMGPGPGTGGAPGDAGTAPAPDSTGSSIFTALQEQLGLKLEPRKGPVDILVIENIEKPSEN